MTKIKKAAAVIALTAASSLVVVGGQALVSDVQFARAEAKVQATSSQLQSVTDLSTVFREVGKVVGPSVVQIDVRKTVEGVSAPGPRNDDFLKKFFKDHGLQQGPNGQPQAPDAQGDDSNGDDNSQPAPDDGAQEEMGTGSGVIMETDGDTAYILTNNHVAGGASELTVTLADGRVIKGGKTIGADAKADLAVVKIQAEHLIPAKWGDSDLLDRGDWVLAFGSPFRYVGSMTHGIVSALNRQAGILGNQGYENFIQVDAPINPGNSGGPLVNIHGEVVGINTAIASRSGAFSGIGFAIPSDQAKLIYTMLKDKGKVTRGWLGVKIEDVQREPGLAHSFGYDDESGVLVDEVYPDTPAFNHLQNGDIITSIDGKPVHDTQSLRNHIAMIAPGTTTKMGVFRDHKETEIDLKLGEQPDNLMAMTGRGHSEDGKANGDAEVTEALGMRLSNVTDELAEKYSLDTLRKGALITSVKNKSIARKNGLNAGDVITRIGDTKVDNAAEAADALSKADLKKGVRLYVSTPDGSRFVFLQDEPN